MLWGTIQRIPGSVSVVHSEKHEIHKIKYFFRDFQTYSNPRFQKNIQKRKLISGQRRGAGTNVQPARRVNYCKPSVHFTLHRFTGFTASRFTASHLSFISKSFKTKSSSSMVKALCEVLHFS